MPAVEIDLRIRNETVLPRPCSCPAGVPRAGRRRYIVNRALGHKSASCCYGTHQNESGTMAPAQANQGHGAAVTLVSADATRT